MAAELAETDRVRRDLVANVSHELRTPITALQAVLENLVDGVEPARPRDARTMLAQVERLGRLVTQLLDLSRLESGAVPLERTEFRVEPLLAHAVREQQLHAPGIDVAVVVETPGPHRRRRSRARAPGRREPARERGAPHAERRAGRGARPAHGIGGDHRGHRRGTRHPRAETGRVFERFYRADSARAASDGGAGLGLAIAQWIVDLHGGEIHPERREPHGCRMVVTLPRATADDRVHDKERTQ